MCNNKHELWEYGSKENGRARTRRKQNIGNGNSLLFKMLMTIQFSFTRNLYNTNIQTKKRTGSENSEQRTDKILAEYCIVV